MTSKTIKLWAAWIIGIVSFLAMLIMSELLMKELKIPLHTNFGGVVVIEHHFYDEERDSGLTSPGLALNVLAVLFAARIGMAVYTGSISCGVSKEGNVDFLALAGGVTLYGILTAILLNLWHGSTSKLASIVYNISDLVTGAGVFWLCREWRNNRIENIRGKKKEM